MNHNKLNFNLWWGPPKKFNAIPEERKITWLELFFDLVYVILISSATHHLYGHYTFTNLLDYFLLFALIFWGWLNGSLYYELHGTEGLRTRLMMLWQIMAAAAIAVTIKNSEEFFSKATIFTFSILEMYLIYLWWSIGLYDKQHRKLNMPYTICFCLAAFLLLLSFFANGQKWLIVGAIILNFIPPIVSKVIHRIRKLPVNTMWSESMNERLGLLTIILLGEVILGITNGLTPNLTNRPEAWIIFVLCILLTFVVWWLLFTLTSDRPVRAYTANWYLLPILYIPTLSALGLLGALFSETAQMGSIIPDGNTSFETINFLIGVCIALILIGISGISNFMDYPTVSQTDRQRIRSAFIYAASLIVIVSVLCRNEKGTIYLSILLCILFILIFLLNLMWYKSYHKEIQKKRE